MNARTLLVGIGAAAAAATLAACETNDVFGASAGEPTRASVEYINPACAPGPTPAGTASGLGCTTGSSTGTPSGSDANIEGASTIVPAIPSR